MAKGPLKLGCFLLGLPPWSFVPSNLIGASFEVVVVPKGCQHLTFAIQVLNVVFSDKPPDVSSFALEYDLRVFIFDGACRPPRYTAPFWAALPPLLMMVVSNRTPQGGQDCPEGWNKTTHVLHHQALGGVTDWSVYCHVLRRTCSYKAKTTATTQSTPTVPMGMPSFLYHLVEKRIGGIRTPSPELNKFGCETCSVHFESLQNKQPPIWTLPTVYGKNAYVHQRLTPNEMVSCLDLPTEFTSGWNKDMLLDVIHRLTGPVKAPVALGRIIEPVLRAWDAATLNARKRTADMSAITESPYALEPTPAIHLTKRPRTLTFGKAGIPKATPIVDETPHREQSTTWAGQARIKMARYTPPVYLISTATEKAVKHDKAAVPTHLWDARVAFLLGIMKPGFFHQRAFNLLQETMLRRWQQNVRRSWEVWWESHHFMVQETEPWWSSLIQARG